MQLKSYDLWPIRIWRAREKRERGIISLNGSSRAGIEKTKPDFFIKFRSGKRELVVNFEGA